MTPKNMRLTPEQMKQELGALAEQNILPMQLANRLAEKLQQKKVSLTKSQLHKLVEKIASLLQVGGQPSPVPSPGGKPVYQTNMQELVEEVESLKQRLEELEQQKMKWKKGKPGRFVTTKDVIEGEDVYHQEEFQPLYDIPNDPESIIVVMKWLQHLVDNIGKNNLHEILGYYVDIGWISDDVRLTLIDYAKGIVEDPTTTKVPQGTSSLPSKDHIRSLLYIQKLKGCSVDDRFISKIDREMEKITKSLNTYYQQ